MNNSIKIFLAYVLICLLWGTTWIVIKVGLDSLTPMLAVGLRFLGASILLAGIIKYKRLTIQTDSLSILLYLLMGILSFTIPFALVYWGEQYVSSGLTSVLFGTLPFFVIIFSFLIFSVRANRFQIGGVIVGFLGICFIFWDKISLDFSNDLVGMLAIVGSGLLQALVAVLIKEFGKHLHPLTMNFYPVLISGVSMTILGLCFEDMSAVKLDSIAIFSVFYLALFGTIFTFTTYYWLMQRISVVILSLSAFITPIVALVLGAILLDEKLTNSHVAGAILVLIGILFANFEGLIKYYKKRQVRMKG